MNEHEYTLEDLHKAVAQFIIILGAHLPAALTESMISHMRNVAEMTDHGGEPAVAMLTARFAEALRTGVDAKKSRQH